MNRKIYNLLDVLEENGFVAYIVGGYVRDYLLGMESTDIDIATNARPKDVVRLFSNYKTTIYDYGNVVLDSFNYHVEITTFRQDISYEDKRRPGKIVYVDSIEEDIKRRDFTINSMYMDKNECVTDLLNAKMDLHKKMIRMIGDPYVRIKEDALRIMRAVRFATILDFKIDPILKRAIIENKDLLLNLSYERKKEELFKIFTSSNKKYGVKLLKELGLLDILELSNIDMALRTNDIMGIYAACFSSNYPFTKVEKDIIEDVSYLLNKDIDNKMLYEYGLYPISIVCDLRRLNKKKYAKRYEKLAIKDRSEICIKASEICDLLNIEPGSILKDIYSDLEMQIINNKLKNDNLEIKDYLKNNL